MKIKVTVRRSDEERLDDDHELWGLSSLDKSVASPERSDDKGGDWGERSR
jgi:hypothetical protein